MRFRVRTETDSFYVVDTKAKTMVRVPAADGVDLHSDFKVLHWNAFSGDPVIGEPLVFTWNDNTKARITSNVVEVVKLSDTP
jgi:hypothetical protein